MNYTLVTYKREITRDSIIIGKGFSNILNAKLVLKTFNTELFLIQVSRAAFKKYMDFHLGFVHFR